MNWDIIGHQWAAQLLRGHIIHDTLRHAYLITGPEGVGRRTLAVRFTQALNCPSPKAQGTPCGTCHTCQRIERMQHPDLLIVESEEESQTLKVDQVRDMMSTLSLSPYEAPFKVAFLLNFEEASQHAANALLKTLEEPPEQVILILTAEHSDLLLETIVSRCEEVHLRPVPLLELQHWLENRWDLPPETAQLLAHISGGRPGSALYLHRHPDVQAEREQQFEEHDRLLSASRVERFSYVKTFKKDREGLQALLQTWTSLWRDVLHQSLGSETPLINLDRESTITRIAQNIDPQTAQHFLRCLQKADRLLLKNANVLLTAEVVLLDLPHLDL
jgi:DNA polymerase-3 subunit delta'